MKRVVPLWSKAPLEGGPGTRIQFHNADLIMYDALRLMFKQCEDVLI